MSKSALALLSLAVLFGLIVAILVSKILCQLYFEANLLIASILALTSMVPLAILALITYFARKRKDRFPNIGLQTFGAAAMLLSVGEISYKLVLDAPDVVLHAAIYTRNEHNLYFREDFTVKVIASHLLSDNTTYGTYRIAGDTLIISDLRFTDGYDVLNDTIYFVEDYLTYTKDYPTKDKTTYKMSIVSSKHY